MNKREAEEVQRQVRALGFVTFLDDVVPEHDHGYVVRVVADGERIFSDQNIPDVAGAAHFISRHCDEAETRQPSSPGGQQQ